MHVFAGVLSYEYRMSIRRPLFWCVFGILVLWQIQGILLTLGIQGIWNYPGEALWQIGGSRVFGLNMFMPLAAGILLADRLVRDRHLQLDNLLPSFPLKPWPYLLGKYTGALLSGLTPAFITLCFFGLSWLQRGVFVKDLLILALAFLSITVPAYVFVTAFSLACPLIMPLRVYQVLFAGYWIWGNYINPDAIPTLRGTLLSANGELAHQGLFGGWTNAPAGWIRYTPLDAVLNILVLMLCSLAVLVAAERYCAWQKKQL
ncbi:MAG: hypothetical protein ACOYYS_14970 [Chloroflexota bacterium]